MTDKVFPETHQYPIPLTQAQLQLILNYLELGAHKEVRGIIDYLLATFNTQRAALVPLKQEEVKNEEVSPGCEAKVS